MSDVKLGYDDDEVEDGYKQSSGSDGLADYYMPYMYTATQYYPFGSPLPGRDFVLQSTCDTTVVNDTLEVVNEAFATGVGGFVSLNAGGTVSNESGQLKFQKTCTTPGCPAYGGDRTFTQVSGETYTVKFDLSLPGTCSPTVTVKVLDPSNGVISTQTYNTSGTKSFTFTTTAGGTGKIEFSATTCTVFYIDNLNIGYTAQTTCITCHGGYRFGFNGMEKTDEWQGGGMSYDFNFRVSDPRIGRFLSIDPLTHKLPGNSPYAFAENKVIRYAELEGLEINTYESQLETKGFKQGLTNKEYIEMRQKEGFGMALGLFVVADFVFTKGYLTTGILVFGSLYHNPSSNEEVNKQRDREVTANITSLAGFWAIGRLATLISKGVIKPSTNRVTNDRKVNIYGEGEMTGYDDFAVNPDFQTGGNGIKRPLTSTIPDGGAKSIVINNSPLFEAELAEINRISQSGTTVQYTAPPTSKFFESLAKNMGDNAILITDATSTLSFEGSAIQIRTVTYVIK